MNTNIYTFTTATIEHQFNYNTKQHISNNNVNLKDTKKKATTSAQPTQGTEGSSNDKTEQNFFGNRKTQSNKQEPATKEKHL